MPSVFPYFGSIGNENKHAYRESLRIYDDGTYRRYLRSTFNHREASLQFSSLSRTKMEAIRDFFNARKQTTTADEHEFIFYDADESTLAAPDDSGLDQVGQHKAIFLDSEITFVRDGKCRWSTSVRVKLLT